MTAEGKERKGMVIFNLLFDMSKTSSQQRLTRKERRNLTEQRNASRDECVLASVRLWRGVTENLFL